MIQVTERARETFKNRLAGLIERPGVMLHIGSTDSGLEIFPDTLKDDDQIVEHDGRAVLLIDQEVSETLARGHDRRRGARRRRSFRGPEIVGRQNHLHHRRVDT
jgi:hypothetical protein